MPPWSIEFISEAEDDLQKFDAKTQDRIIEKLEWLEEYEDFVFYEKIKVPLSERDLFSLKSRAIEKGLPYQTLLASVLHQYSTGTLLERRQRVSSARR